MEAPSPLLLLLGALLVSSAARLSAASTQTVEVLVGVLLPEDLGSPSARARVAPALNLSLEGMEPDLRHAGLAVRLALVSIEQDGRCYDAVAQFKAAELRGSLDPDVLLGLGCFYRSAIEESFAHYWQLPVLRAGRYQRDSGFSTTIYFGPVGPSVRVFKDRLLQHLNWTARPALFINLENEPWPYDSFAFIYDESLDVRISYLHDYKQPGETVRFIKARGRVFIYGSLKILHQIMYLAQAQNMTNGDYVFFYLDIFGESLRAEGHREASKPWQSKESQDMGSLQEAFKTVLVITAHEPRTPEYQRFQSQLILRAQKDYGVTLNDSLGHLVAGCFHDGLLLYLRALNEMLCEGGTKRDTSRILEKMRGQKFQGITGMVNINKNGDREMDFDLWAMKDVRTGEYQVVAHYTASEKNISLMGQIHWKAGRPPLDNPPCVFNKNDPSCGTRLRDHDFPSSQAFGRRRASLETAVPVMNSSLTFS